MIQVKESFKLSNGIVIAFLQWADGKLPPGTLLVDANKKQWRISHFQIMGIGVTGMQLRKQREAENIYDYRLEGIGHEEKPTKGTILFIV